MPLVDLSSLECVSEPDKHSSLVDVLPVSDVDIQTSHPVVDPHPAVPLVNPPPVVALPPPAVTPPLARRRRLNEVEHLFDWFEHHPLHGEGVEDVPVRIEGDHVDDGLEQELWASLVVLTQESGSPVSTTEDVTVLAATTGTDCDNTAAPTSLHEALQRPDTSDWIEAICWEVDSLTHTNTFSEVDQVPTSFTPIGSKFVFSLKKDVSGKVI